MHPAEFVTKECVATHLPLCLMRRADSFGALRSALEVYYKRTLTGQFHGQYKVSLAFEDLIRQMVEPSVARRLATCAKGLTHPFFSLRPPSVMGGDGQSRG